MSNLTLALDRNERAIAVDPKGERGKKIFRELVATAGMTPGGTRLRRAADRSIVVRWSHRSGGIRRIDWRTRVIACPLGDSSSF
ncbi:hypothetical protein [Lentzea indica]|uniref:hypothetical protein n=1 Tax=Lentzea indica TaxID=2604800 RepID=UPI001439CC80|nr:hypothetical protein [Lentzea indica]